MRNMTEMWKREEHGKMFGKGDYFRIRANIVNFLK
jgi:hypothetical protein